jgi:hypothetical protein
MLFLVFVSYDAYTQNEVRIKILDSIVYGEKLFDVSITNNSNDAYLFLMDNLYQGQNRNLPFGMLEFAYPIMLLEDFSDENEIPRSTIIYSGQSFDDDDYSYIDTIFKFKEQFKPEGKGFVYLKPNESYDFTMSLSLAEENRYYHQVDNKMNYKLYIWFRPHLYKYERYIPKETLEFIKEHNILVYEGELISNKVTLSF